MKDRTKLIVSFGAVLIAVMLATVWNALTPGGTHSALPASARAPGDEIVIIDGVAMIDINLADADMLASLTMIDADKARAIVEWRNENGRYESVEQAVKLFAGRSKKTADEMRAYLTVTDKQPRPTTSP